MHLYITPTTYLRIIESYLVILFISYPMIRKQSKNIKTPSVSAKIMISLYIFNFTFRSLNLGANKVKSNIIKETHKISLK